MQGVLTKPRTNTLQPRRYQEEITSDAVKMFNGEYIDPHHGKCDPVTSIMIESPTGSGKTAMANMICSALQEADNDLVVGWVAMRRNLLDQARRECLRFNFAIKNIHYTSMFDKNPEALTQARRDGRRILMVIDESQHDAASSMSHLHNTIEPDLVLGMTATPFRTDKMKLCFQKVIKRAGIHQLIQDGFLSPYDHYTIPEWSPHEIADHFCADPGRWGKSIFYFVSLEECYELGRLFAKRGVSHAVVKGGQQKATDDILERFENGEIQCLINCMVLTEGFDCPSLKTAWVRDSSRGPTMQMGGRTFRIFGDLPVKQIVQSKQTKWPFVRTAMPHQQFVWVHDDWRSLKVNPHLERINVNSRLVIAQTEVDLPKYLLDRKGKKKRVNRF